MAGQRLVTAAPAPAGGKSQSILRYATQVKAPRPGLPRAPRSLIPKTLPQALIAVIWSTGLRGPHFDMAGETPVFAMFYLRVTEPTRTVQVGPVRNRRPSKLSEASGRAARELMSTCPAPDCRYGVGNSTLATRRKTPAVTIQYHLRPPRATLPCRGKARNPAVIVQPVTQEHLRILFAIGVK